MDHTKPNCIPHLDFRLTLNINLELRVAISYPYRTSLEPTAETFAIKSLSTLLTWSILESTYCTAVILLVVLVLVTRPRNS